MVAWYSLGLYCLGLVSFKVYGHKPVRAEQSKIFLLVMNLHALL